MKPSAALALATMLVLTACSRSGSVYGDVFIQGQSGKATRAGRISVSVVQSTEAFERDWAAAVAAFREEHEDALQAQKDAAFAVEEARKAWGQVLARRGTRRQKRSPIALNQEQELRRQLRAADEVLFQAKRRVVEVARKHGDTGRTLLNKYLVQTVQTDETGHYVVAGIPAGNAYVHAHFRVGSRELAWFQPVEVRRGARQVDLTEANSTTWPFVP